MALVDRSPPQGGFFMSAILVANRRNPFASGRGVWHNRIRIFTVL